MSDEIIEHLSAACVFHHQIQRLIRLDDLVQLHNVRVVQELHDPNLTKQFLQTCLVQLRFINYLDGNLASRWEMLSKFHLGEISLTNRLDQFVFTDVDILTGAGPGATAVGFGGGGVRLGVGFLRTRPVVVV